jgi:RimK family alpha-L-glutamate ligase
MRVTILSARQGWHTERLSAALAAAGHDGRVLPYESLTARLGATSAPSLSAGSELLDQSDAVLARIIPAGSLEQIIFRVDALHTLEDGGITVLNSPRAIERTVDKFYTSALLQAAGLPTPETVVCERPEDAMSAFRAIGDAVIKPLFGSMGLGIVRVSDEETAWRVFRAIEAIRGVYYVQRVLDHGGRDVRAFVVGDRILAAIERQARDPGGWRTNISRGGAARAVHLSCADAQLALDAARTVGADYAGVDLLTTTEGTTYVLEVNGIPGWRGLEQATGHDVAGEIVSLLERRVERGGR